LGDFTNASFFDETLDDDAFLIGRQISHQPEQEGTSFGFDPVVLADRRRLFVGGETDGLAGGAFAAVEQRIGGDPQQPGREREITFETCKRLRSRPRLPSSRLLS